MIERDNSGVMAPPPLIFLGGLLLGFALDFLILRLATGLPPALRYGLGVVFLVLGGALIVAAIGRFRRAGTRPEPWKPSTSVVTEGVYAFTRNPMYLAMTLVYLAASLAADSIVALLLLPLVLIVLHYGVIAREERYLEGKFGDGYRRYKASVRRWL